MVRCRATCGRPLKLPLRLAANGRAKHASSQRTALPQIPTPLGWGFLCAPALLRTKPGPVGPGLVLGDGINLMKRNVRATCGRLLKRPLGLATNGRAKHAPTG